MLPIFNTNSTILILFNEHIVIHTEHNLQSLVTFFTTAVFVPKSFDIKQSFCCYELKFMLNWYICANTTDIVKNFAVIKSVSIQSFHCIFNAGFNPHSFISRLKVIGPGPLVPREEDL